MKAETRNNLIVAGVWICRLLIGAVFIASGLSKMIDLWGTVYKIEEYLKVWDMWQPRSIVFMVSLLLSGGEFLLGSFLLLGCYRRSAVWLMLVLMAGMLPLTFYIYVKNPVSDCGCFGDLFHLSNASTFWKNVAITAGLLFLAKYNRRVVRLFSAWIQWLVAAMLIAYLLIIGLYGYNIQPLVDFRSFPVGGELIPESTDSERTRFIYEKDGRQEVFDMDNLPGDDWTYVDRIDDSSQRSLTEMAVFDESGEEVTSDVLPLEGNAIILVIPEISRAEISYTYFLNELNDRVTSSGGKMLALVAGSHAEMEAWKDLAMASYPVYSAESTLLKEFSRGNMSIVSVADGRIIWKRNLSTIDPERFIKEYDTDSPEDVAPLNGPSTFRYLSILLIVLLAVLYMLDSTGRLLKWRLRGKSSE